MYVGSYSIRVICAALAIAAHLLGAAAAQANEALRIGYFDIPPHVAKAEGGKPTGAAIGYFEEYIAPHLGMPIEWDTEVTSPTRLMSPLQ